MLKIDEIIQLLHDLDYPSKKINDANYEVITQLSIADHRTFLKFEITEDIIRIEVKHLFGSVDLNNSICTEELFQMLLDNTNGTYKKTSKYIGLKIIENTPYAFLLGYNYFHLKWDSKEIADIISLQLSELKFAFTFDGVIPKYIDTFQIRSTNSSIYSFEVNSNSEDIIKNFNEEIRRSVRILGRIINIRKMGRASFCHIKDDKGKIQVYLKKDEIGEMYDTFNLMTEGDTIGVEGYVFKTKTGEISIFVKSLSLLSKL